MSLRELQQRPPAILWLLVTAAAIATALLEGHDPSRVPVEAIADRDPPLAAADEALADVHQRMRGAERPLAVVVSREGKPLGLVSDPEAAP